MFAALQLSLSLVSPYRVHCFEVDQQICTQSTYSILTTLRNDVSVVLVTISGTILGDLGVSPPHF